MKITKLGTDFIKISEQNLFNEDLLSIPKVHLIKLAFLEPNIEKVEKVINDFPKTNRYVIGDNIRFYNETLKGTNKKYYICNNENTSLISFYKRNNKVMLDTTKLSDEEKFFVFNVALQDILNNTEVVIVELQYYKDFASVFNRWNGNLVVV